MNNRLLEIIKYKTGGRQTEFAALMGWSPQYLTKLLRGDGFGIQPVLSVLSNLPEINARWLLLGEGEMLLDRKYTEIRMTMYDMMKKVLDIEKYMPVMTPEELRRFERSILGKDTPDFSPETVEKWDVLLKERENEINERFKTAIEKSKKPCKQTKTKK